MTDFNSNIYFGNLCFEIEGENSIVDKLISYTLKWGPFSKNKKERIFQSYHIEIHPISDRIKFIEKITKENENSLHKETFISNKKIFVLFGDNIAIFIPQKRDFSEGYPILIHFIENHSFEIVYSQHSNILNYFFWSVLKEIYITYYESLGWSLYHANGLAVNHKEGILLMAGPKCGKSTLMCHFTAVTKSAFPLSDDRILIKENLMRAVPSVTNYYSSNLVENHPFTYINNFFYEKNFSYENYLQISLINIAQERGSLNKNYNIGVVIMPQFSPNLECPYRIELLNSNEKLQLYKNNLITPIETWRDKYFWERPKSNWNDNLFNHDVLKVFFRANFPQKELYNKLVARICT